MNVEAGFPRRSSDEADPRPTVALPRSGVPGIAIAAVALLAAIILFFLLDGRRERLASEQQVSGLPVASVAAPPPLAIPQEPALQPPGYIIYPPQSAPPLVVATPRQDRSVSLPEPQVNVAPVPAPTYEPVDGQYFAGPPAPPQMVAEPPAPASRTSDAPAVVIGSGISHGTRFAVAPVGGASKAAPANDEEKTQQSLRIGKMGHPASVMPAGSLIAAVLETPIDTARPGLVRAIVSKDAYGFGGSQVLIPRGSRLIGEYQSDIGVAQNRVMVGWSRLILPDGTSISLAAPAADASGGAGIPGRVHGFFLTRFFNAALQTAMAIGGNLASQQSNTVIVGMPAGAVTNLPAQSLAPSTTPSRKITVRPGTLVNVFVAEDLDFSSAASES